MMESEKQVIEGARGSLEKLINAFFKSLDGALSKAAEYQKENGILKQVSKIFLADGDGNEYTLTIKLAPVKDKDEIFYVTAETDAPGLDLTSINKKAFRLNESTKPKFEAMIDKIVENGNLEYAEEQDNEEEKSDNVKKISKLVEDAAYQLEDRELIIKDADDDFFLLEPEFDYEEGEIRVVVTISLTDKDGKVTNKFPKESRELVVVEQGEVIDLDTFLDDISDVIYAYIENHDLDIFERDDIASSTFVNSVRATFVKSSETNRIQLTAINSSCSIERAIGIISEVTASHEFTDTLSDEPRSFQLTEYKDGYDVEPVDVVETSCYVRSDTKRIKRRMK